MNKLTHRGLCTASTSFKAITTKLQLSSLTTYQFPNPHYRYASSSSNLKTTTTANPPIRSSINGPLSTHPVPLTLPTRSASPSSISYYFSLGKAFATFYKAGVKNIYYNFRSAQVVQELVDKKHSHSVFDAVRNGGLTRSDFQLLNRSWHDIKRVPLFGLVFIICGEFTPLVVIAISSIVPWTCRIPKQILNDRTKLEKRRKISFRYLTAEPPKGAGVEALERQQLVHINWSLGLSSSLWDYLGGRYPGLPNAVLRRKIKGRVEYLMMDDTLLGGGEGVKEMDEEEIRMALVERGVDVLEKKKGQLRSDLVAWLKSRDKAPVERLLLTRPNSWPTKPST